MNVNVRAGRILMRLKNYHATVEDSYDSVNAASAMPGKCIGFYKNPGSRGCTVVFYDEGLAWMHGGNEIIVNFSDIAEVSLPDGKESQSLILKTKDDRQLKLPIEGCQDQFFDSLEVLRFLDRILIDKI